MSESIEWAAVDWGTSNVRAWAIVADGSHGPPLVSTQGMGKLAPAQFPEVLAYLLREHLPSAGHQLDVVICGMAGARQGWCEAPYLDVPTTLSALGRHGVRPSNAPSGLSVIILPGLCKRQTGQEDIMRGEETQLLGLMTQRPAFEGAIVLPGTHSKWARIEHGRVVGFSTAMTGELHAAIATGTVLANSIAPNANGDAHDQGVDDGLRDGLEHPNRLTSTVFRTRAAGLISGQSPAWSAGYLSGLLVGSEVAGYQSWFIGQTSVPIVGSKRLGTIYAAALARMGIKGDLLDADAVTVAGLRQAYMEIKR